jgi:hypothetical protein
MNSSNPEESVLFFFLNTLLELEITTQSLESIHAVCKKFDLPPDFLQKYLLKCMEFCSKTKETAVQVFQLVLLVFFLISNLLTIE